MIDPKTEVWWCGECTQDHPPGYQCPKRLWAEFFRVDRKLMVHDYPECGAGSQSIEEMYQAFKARLMSELGVRTWDHAGPHESGELVERHKN